MSFGLKPSQRGKPHRSQSCPALGSLGVATSQEATHESTTITSTQTSEIRSSLQATDVWSSQLQRRVSKPSLKMNKCQNVAHYAPATPAMLGSSQKPSTLLKSLPTRPGIEPLSSANCGTAAAANPAYTKERLDNSSSAALDAGPDRFGMSLLSKSLKHVASCPFLRKPSAGKLSGDRDALTDFLPPPPPPLKPPSPSSSPPRPTQFIPPVGRMPKLRETMFQLDEGG